MKPEQALHAVVAEQVQAVEFELAQCGVEEQPLAVRASDGDVLPSPEDGELLALVQEAAGEVGDELVPASSRGDCSQVGHEDA